MVPQRREINLTLVDQGSARDRVVDGLLPNELPRPARYEDERQPIRVEEQKPGLRGGDADRQEGGVQADHAPPDRLAGDVVDRVTTVLRQDEHGPRPGGLLGVRTGVESQAHVRRRFRGGLFREGRSARILADDERLLDVQGLFEKRRQPGVAGNLGIEGQDAPPGGQRGHRLAVGIGLFDLGDLGGKPRVLHDRVLGLRERGLDAGGQFRRYLAVRIIAGRHRLGRGRSVEQIPVFRRLRRAGRSQCDLRQKAGQIGIMFVKIAAVPVRLDIFVHPLETPLPGRGRAGDLFQHAGVPHPVLGFVRVAVAWIVAEELFKQIGSTDHNASRRTPLSPRRILAESTRGRSPDKSPRPPAPGPASGRAFPG